MSVESWFVGLVTIGEGWHNYHHAFPWDYRASEVGAPLNITRYVIEICAFFGLAYDLKSASLEMIEKRALRTGDGSLYFAKEDPLTLFFSKHGPWGFLKDWNFLERKENIEQKIDKNDNVIMDSNVKKIELNQAEVTFKD